MIEIASAGADMRLRERCFAAAAAVEDPELPPLTIADLGVLRAVEVRGQEIEVVITPTYSGCPAMSAIALDIELAFARQGLPRPRVRTAVSPPWTSDWLTAEGRRKLAEIGVAPPTTAACRHQDHDVGLACPRCGSADTERLSQFGSTACKALWRCRSCREPFDQFKCH